MMFVLTRILKRSSKNSTNWENQTICSCKFLLKLEGLKIPLKKVTFLSLEAFDDKVMRKIDGVIFQVGTFQLVSDYRRDQPTDLCHHFTN